MSTQVLPSDTASLFRRHAAACTNLGLLLDKYQPWENIGGKWELTFRVRGRRGDEAKRGGEAKGLWLRDQPERKSVDSPLLPRTRIDREAVEAYRQRWEAAARSQGGEPFVLKTDWRMVVGLGGASVLETAMTLHRIYGFPIVPGSALKGLTRAGLLLTVAEALGVPVLPLGEYEKRRQRKLDTPLERLEAFLTAEADKVEDAWEALRLDPALDSAPLQERALGDVVHYARAFCAAFGHAGETGQLVFFDGVPNDVPQFALDVMNPHYPDYYSDRAGKVPPADYQDPKPVYFLTVAGGCRFCFAVAPRTPQAGPLARQASDWLRDALTRMGAGAKTVTGYGYFHSV
jgi:CRISPR type III-B/RAMP module RAMP protein Cmr6